MGAVCCAFWEPKSPDFESKSKKVAKNLRAKGLGKTGVIFGIDFTSSNIRNGTNSFRGMSLHHVFDSPATYNLYEQVIDILGNVLVHLNKDESIPAYIFGDDRTLDKIVRPVTSSLQPATEEGLHDIREVLAAYRDEAKVGNFSAAPTTYKPLIEKAIAIQQAKKTFQTLVIITDGVVTNLKENIEAIEEAAKYPLAIIIIGVGDGDGRWGEMKALTGDEHSRKYENVAFYHYASNLVPFDFATKSLGLLPLLYLHYKSRNLCD